MQPSQSLVDFIKRHEGFRAQAYRPLPTDRWTIGYGSTFIEDYAVIEGDVITEEAATALLRTALSRIAANLAKKGLPTNLTSNQFDAVVSLVYNIGINTFNNSATGELFYQGHNISDRFALYNKSAGRVIPGLITRRNEEKKIYDSGLYV